MAAPKEHKDLSKETLTARLRDAAKKPLPFVFALSKSGKGSHLVLHKIKSGKSLLTFVRGKQPDAGKAAYGTATLTPTGLVLDCEKELPGMTPAAKAWVAANRHPKVKKIRVQVAGEEVPDEDEVAQGKPKKDAAEKPKKGKAEKPQTDPVKTLAAAMKGWQTARKGSVAQLSKLAKAIAGTKLPKARQLLIMLKAIQANLTEKPDSLQKVAELERYLKTDDVIADAESPNPFGFRVSVRKPLLAALGPLKSTLGKG